MGNNVFLAEVYCRLLASIAEDKDLNRGNVVNDLFFQEFSRAEL